ESAPPSSLDDGRDAGPPYRATLSFGRRGGRARSDGPARAGFGCRCAGARDAERARGDAGYRRLRIAPAADAPKKRRTGEHPHEEHQKKKQEAIHLGPPEQEIKGDGVA